jgi:hypothetical protein
MSDIQYSFKFDNSPNLCTSQRFWGGGGSHTLCSTYANYSAELPPMKTVIYGSVT